MSFPITSHHWQSFTHYKPFLCWRMFWRHAKNFLKILFLTNLLRPNRRKNLLSHYPLQKNITVISVVRSKLSTVFYTESELLIRCNETLKRSRCRWINQITWIARPHVALFIFQSLQNMFAIRAHHSSWVENLWHERKVYGLPRYEPITFFASNFMTRVSETFNVVRSMHS